MKKVIFICSILLLALNVCRAANTSEDVVVGFFTEYIDGKETGRAMQMELHLYVSEKKLGWKLEQIMLYNDDYDKSIKFQVFNNESGENTDWPAMKDIKWVKGKSINCLIAPDGSQYITLVAEKKAGTVYGWNIKMCGKIVMHNNPEETKDWVWKSSEELKLKYKKVKKLNMFNK